MGCRRPQRRAVGVSAGGASGATAQHARASSEHHLALAPRPDHCVRPAEAPRPSEGPTQFWEDRYSDRRRGTLRGKDRPGEGWRSPAACW